MMTSLRNLLLGISALLMLGHSLVPHDHSGSTASNFVLWELFSVDLGNDHLQHFAPISCDVAPEDANQVQLPQLGPKWTVESEVLWTPSVHAATPHGSNRTQGHLSSWSRRPPPSSLA